jgi:hypothetical protein
MYIGESRHCASAAATPLLWRWSGKLALIGTETRKIPY